MIKHERLGHDDLSVVDQDIEKVGQFQDEYTFNCSVGQRHPDNSWQHFCQGPETI